MRLLPKFATAIVMTAAAGAIAVAGAATYQVTVVNEIPGGMDTGQPFSPPVAIVHDAGYSLFMMGEAASPGLALVAEEGDPSMLVAEAEADPNVFDVVVGADGPFFDMVQFEIMGDPGDLVSIAFMLGRTNDLFSGLADVALPNAGAVVLENINVYDAGSEMNTGMIEHIPFYGGSNAGPDENGTVAMSIFYEVVDDPTYGVLQWEFPPSGTITIERTDPTPTEETTWGSVKALFD